MALESLSAIARDPLPRPSDPGSIPERIALLNAILLRDHGVIEAAPMRRDPIRPGNTRL